MKWNYFNMRTLGKILFKRSKLKENHYVTEEEMIKQEYELRLMLKNQKEVLKSFGEDYSIVDNFFSSRHL